MKKSLICQKNKKYEFLLCGEGKVEKEEGGESRFLTRERKGFGAFITVQLETHIPH